jgi:hypothetical protein
MILWLLGLKLLQSERDKEGREKEREGERQR